MCLSEGSVSHAGANGTMTSEDGPRRQEHDRTGRILTLGSITSFVILGEVLEVEIFKPWNPVLVLRVVVGFGPFGPGRLFFVASLTWSSVGGLGLDGVLFAGLAVGGHLVVMFGLFL